MVRFLVPHVTALATPALVATLLWGCAARPAVEAAWPLEGTYWKLVNLRGQPAAQVQPGREPYIVLQAATRRVAGNSGCNRLAGSYTLQGDALRFGQAVGTRMACISGMDVEASFLSMLGDVRTWRLAGDSLQLVDGGGAVAAEFASGSERYACDDGTRLLVHYDNTDAQRKEAWLTHEGQDYRLRGVPVASGARYAVEPGGAPGRALEWSTKGAEGLLREGTAGSATESWKTVVRCVRK